MNNEHLERQLIEISKIADKLEQESQKQKEVIDKIQKQNTELKDNWNKLRECLKDVMYSYDNKIFEKTIEAVLDVMQELEQGTE